jgi:hypothetical protein
LCAHHAITFDAETGRGQNLGAVETLMRKTTFFLAALLLASTGSLAMAKHRKPVHEPGYAAPAPVYLSPEAAHMKEMQKMWPGRPLCDDGGYRIVPCDMSPGAGGRQ